MKNRKKTVGQTKIESEGDVDVVDGERIAALRQVTHEYLYYRERHRLVSYILWICISLAGAIFSSIGVSFVFSDLPQIPQAYASLISIVISSVVGVSVIFLVARITHRRHKSESEEVFHRVRSKEKELFEMLDLDFGSIMRRRELDARQTN